MSRNTGGLVCHSLSLSLSLFTLPLSSEVHCQASSPPPPPPPPPKKDYRLIQDARVEDLIWGILHPLSHIPAERGAFSFTSCRGAYQKGNAAPTLERRECLIILLRRKKDLGVPGSKCVSQEGLGAISVNVADAPKGSGL